MITLSLLFLAVFSNWICRKYDWLIQSHSTIWKRCTHWTYATTKSWISHNLLHQFWWHSPLYNTLCFKATRYKRQQNIVIKSSSCHALFSNSTVSLSREMNALTFLNWIRGRQTCLQLARANNPSLLLRRCQCSLQFPKEKVSQARKVPLWLAVLMDSRSKFMEWVMHRLVQKLRISLVSASTNLWSSMRLWKLKVELAISHMTRQRQVRGKNFILKLTWRPSEPSEVK